MRNILQYPITDEERIETLKRVSNDILAEECIGDLRALIVQEAAEDVEKLAKLEKDNKKLIAALNKIITSVTEDADTLRDMAESTLNCVQKHSD